VFTRISCCLRKTAAILIVPGIWVLTRSGYSCLQADVNVNPKAIKPRGQSSCPATHHLTFSIFSTPQHTKLDGFLKRNDHWCMSITRGIRFLTWRYHWLIALELWQTLSTTGLVGWFDSGIPLSVEVYQICLINSSRNSGQTRYRLYSGPPRHRGESLLSFTTFEQTLSSFLSYFQAWESVLTVTQLSAWPPSWWSRTGWKEDKKAWMAYALIFIM
jgi:hypothetical protein